MNDSTNQTFGTSAPSMIDLDSPAGHATLMGTEAPATTVPAATQAPIQQAVATQAVQANAAPGTPITQLYPTLKAYTKEQLAGMTSEQLQHILTGVNQTAEQVNGKVIQLSTQIESVTTQLTEMTGRLQSEFGVSSVEELDALRQKDLQNLEDLYATLSGLNLETTS